MEDILDEIHDIVKPATPGRITLKDLLRCGQGGLVVSMMADVNGFLRYDDRQFEADDQERTDISDPPPLSATTDSNAEDAAADQNTTDYVDGSDQPKSI